jgi:hypothetical protein
MTISRRLFLAQCLCAAVVVLSLAATPARAYDWLQFGGDAQHSGHNTLETTITKGNVNTLAQKYSVAIGATADGAPVFLDDVNTSGGVKDLLFVTTMDGRIIALDSLTGAIVWSHQYGPGACRINGSGGACYTTSSPAIDPNRLYVYSYGLDGYVHKYQVGDGTEILTGGWPQLTTLKGFDEKGSGAISFASSGGNNYLYVVHGGYPGDNGDYQGHVTAINLATGAQMVFNASCSDQAVHLKPLSGGGSPTCPSPRNAIWSRPGVIYDAGTDRIFMGTGNGTFTGNTGGHAWSESVIALHPDGSGGTGVNAGKPLDSYTPSNHQSLDNADADLGSTAPAILPVPVTSAVQHLALQGGKDSQLRLINLANLSGLGGPGHVMGDPGAIQVGSIINLPQGGTILSQPAVWVNPADASTWAFIVNNNGTAAYKVVFDGSGNPSLSLQWNNGTGGTSPVVANGVLFNVGGNTVRARDPQNGNALWSSSVLGGTHWHSLIVANGAVYTTDGSAHLFRFALPNLTPTTTVVTSSLNPSTFGTSVTFTATITGGASPTGSVGFTDSGTFIAGCNAVVVSAAKATCTTSTLAVGTHSIVGTYGGDASNAGSASAALSQTVNTGSGSINVALAANGGVASASSTYSSGFGSYAAASVIDGERAGVNWGSGGGWQDGTGWAFPDYVQINFSGPKTIDHIIVYSLQDSFPRVNPSDTMTFTKYGITDFQAQGWNGASWVTLGSVAGNGLVKRTVNFTAATTDRIRINVTGGLAGYSRIVEVEAWTTGGSGPAPTVTTLGSSLNPSTFGAGVTFTASVTGVAPTGTVNFKDGATSITGCSAVALTGSGNTRTTICSTSSLSVATHNITATYSGDAGNLTSTSTPLSQVVTSGGGGPINVALAANGGVASASSTYPFGTYPVASVIDGDRSGINWGQGGGWQDGTAWVFPDYVQVNFSGVKTIDHVIVYSLQDSAPRVDPSDTMIFTKYGITDFQVQGWNGAGWVTLGIVAGNNLVKRTVNFAATATDRIRVNFVSGMAGYSRIVEVEAWGN